MCAEEKISQASESKVERGKIISLRMKRIIWLLAILTCGAILFKYGVLRALNFPTSIAFNTYYNAAKAVASGESPYVFRDEPNIYCYPLFLSMILSPFSALQYETAKSFWFFGNWIALIICALVIISWANRYRNTGVDIKARKSRAVVAIIFIVSYIPLLYTFCDGQIDLWVATVTLLGIYLGRFERRAIAGVFLAISILLKLAPLVWLPGLIFLLRWRGILALIITGIVYELLVVASGWGGAEWYYLTEILPRWQLHPYLPSFSLFHTVYYWGLRSGADKGGTEGVALSFLWIGRLWAMGTYAIVLWQSWRKKFPAIVPAATGILLSFYIMPIVELNHLIWLIVPLTISLMEKSGGLKLKEIALVTIAWLLGFFCFELNQTFGLWWGFQLGLLIPLVIGLLYLNPSKFFKNT